MTARSEATQTSSTFRSECSIRCKIAAPPAGVWALLTDARGFPRWNSTVTSIDGDIALGNKLALRVPASERTFTPKVVELVPERRMVWADGMAPMFKGTRTFTLEAQADGTTLFTMTEVFAGVMLPMIRGSLPDFGPIFEKYADDLRCEAERAGGRS
ncbi:MAG: SRPBCC domain-containing protein [Polyangiaceae bacterium]|jgi:hypothetical protein|nr:SRPBCC domain-containing protein [Polyangiaceae bacterium]